VRRALSSAGVPSHLRLAYDAWAPVDDSSGKVSDSKRLAWFGELEAIAVDKDYSRAFERWTSSFSAPGDRVFELALASRLLVGHGNGSAAEVGITVHHTWGVPVIPGSALKGLAAHFVDAVYGPEDPKPLPWEQPEGQRARVPYRGVLRTPQRIVRGPGAVYRALFGAPDADEDNEMREHRLEAGASAGLVTFHDALYVPKSAPKDQDDKDYKDQPFAADVLTVHQKDYYDRSGKTWPNDYDSPNPVGFVTVRPRVRMLFALSGPPEWTELAEHLLSDALESWGVGGKTSSGYGRLSTPAKEPPPKKDDVVECVLLAERTKKGGVRARHEASGWEGHIQGDSGALATAETGSRWQLRVFSVTSRDLIFCVPTAPAPPAPKKTKGR